MYDYGDVIRIFATLCLSLSQVLTLPVIDPRIAEKLGKGNETTIIISFLKSDFHKIVDSYESGRSGKEFQSREAKFTALHKELTEHANQLHQVTLQVIQSTQRPGGQKPYDFYSMWASSELIVGNADKALMQELSKSTEIERIRQENEYKVELVLPEDGHEGVEKEGVERQGREWGVQSLGCLRVWESGNRGKGVVVGFIDSGASADHEALKDNFRSNYGWFEPELFSKRPYDVTSHGTSVISVAVGTKKDMSCAPEAKWIACKLPIGSIEGEGVRETVYARCLNFMLCPTDTDGKNPNCDLAPKIVSASISYGQGNGGIDELDKYFKLLKAKNIVVIFAIGNYGPKCGTAVSPGDSEYVIGVGATDNRQHTTAGSSRGPPMHNKTLIKPDVVAPGRNMLAAAAGKNFKSNSYRYSSGSSVAAPNVAALAALYFHDFPNATVDEFKDHLISSTRAVYPHGKNCGGLYEGQYPNHVAGYGQVDAVNLLNLAHGRQSLANQIYQFKSQLKMILSMGFLCLLQLFI